MWDQIAGFFNDHGTVTTIGLNIIKIIILFVVIRIAMGLLNKVVNRTLEMRTHMDERRRETMSSMFSNIIRYVCYFVFVLTVLPIFNIHIGALLAGAGVAGIAIAFAAQNLLKDFFNGFFILFEDQYGVGDYVVINGIWGAVKTVGLRITTIQVWTGEVVTFPNGEISQVINYSKENSFAVIDVRVGYNADTEKVMGIVERVMNKLKDEQETIIGDVDVLGVQEINEWNYTVRAIAECESYTHWGIQRLAKQRLRDAFVEEGVDLPFQKIVYFPHGKLPESFHPEEPMQQEKQTTQVSES